MHKKSAYDIVYNIIYNTIYYCHRRRADAPRFFNYSIFLYFFLFPTPLSRTCRVCQFNTIFFFFLSVRNDDVFNTVGWSQANVVMNRKTGFIHKGTAVYGRYTRTRRRRSANIYYY